MRMPGRSDISSQPARNTPTRLPVVRDNRIPARAETPSNNEPTLAESRDAALTNLPAGADLDAMFPGSGGGGESVTPGQAVNTMLMGDALPFAATAMAPGMSAATLATRTRQLTAAREAGQRGAGLRNQTIRGINRDRAAVDDPRGPIPTNRAARRAAQSE
jgi:hypothetical protein